MVEAMKDPELFVLFLADLHVGSYWGIWHPDCEMKKSAAMEEGSKWTLNDFQKPLWRYWLDLCKWLKPHPPDIIISLADLIDGAAVKRWGGELVTDKAEIQIESALMLLRMIPVKIGITEFLGVSSSPYHDIKFFSAMNDIAKGWTVKRNGQREIAVKGKYLGRAGIIDVLGHKIQLYHGSSQAYVYREMLKARARLFATESMHIGKIPDFEAIVNGHQHFWLHMKTAWHDGIDFQMVACPSFQAQTDFMAWRDPNKLTPDIGVAYARVTRERIEFDRRLYPTPVGILKPIIAGRT